MSPANSECRKLPQFGTVGNRRLLPPQESAERGCVLSKRQRSPNSLFVAINATKLQFGPMVHPASTTVKSGHVRIRFAAALIAAFRCRRGFPNSCHGCRCGPTFQKVHSPCRRRCGSLLFAIPSAVGSIRFDSARHHRRKAKQQQKHPAGSCIHSASCFALRSSLRRKTEALRRAGSRPSGSRYLWRCCGLGHNFSIQCF